MLNINRYEQMLVNKLVVDMSIAVNALHEPVLTGYFIQYFLHNPSLCEVNLKLNEKLISSILVEDFPYNPAKLSLTALVERFLADDAKALAYYRLASPEQMLALHQVLQADLRENMQRALPQGI